MAADQKQVRYPVPVGGINTRDNVMDIGVEYGYWINNLLSRPTGLEVRRGWKYWLANGFAFNGEVRTLMPYSNPGGVNNKLFASTSEINSPIYDITDPNTSPAVAFTPASGAFREGEWSSLNFNTPTTSFLCAVLFGSGYYLYDTTAGWRKVADGSGAGAIKFEHAGTTYLSSTMLFCFSWKSRLWFLQGSTGLAWYLPVNQVTGTAKAIDLGQFLRHGGGLAYATSWTFDSGNGIDDNLIFVGNNGDMVIYQGTNPDTAANFQLKGQWYVGRIPVGRRGFCAYGGDVVIITEYGMMSVSELVSGKLASLADENMIGAKYNPSLARYVSDYISNYYWQVVSYPGQEVLFVCSPALEPEFQMDVTFTMSHFSKAWSTHTNIPALCAEVFQGQMYFGTKDGKIALAFSGFHDGASYDGVEQGNEVTGYLQTGFYDMGSSTANKRATRLRLLGRCDGNPGYMAAIKSEYDLENMIQAPGPAANDKPLWDVALWDQATWQSRTSTFKRWFGVSSFGKKLSVQIAIRGLGYTLLTDYEVTFTEGIGL